MPLTIKEAIEWVRSSLGTPEKSELFSASDIVRFLDVATKKTIALISTFTDEIFLMNSISSVHHPPISLPLSLPSDCLRLKTVLLNGKYVHKKDLNTLFAKKTYQTLDTEPIYALQGNRYLWIHPLPTTAFTLTFYYLSKSPDLTRQSENFDLETIIPPFAIDMIIAYAVAQCFLKIGEVNGYQVFLRNFYDTITILQQTLQISPPKGAINPMTPQQT
jgi:hypothetical protein